MSLDNTYSMPYIPRMLSDRDAHLLELYFSRGHAALAAEIGHLQADDFLHQPHIIPLLERHDANIRRADLFTARHQRARIYQALEQQLDSATDPEARFRAAWALLRATQVPLLTPPQRAPARRPEPAHTEATSHEFRAPSFASSLPRPGELGGVPRPRDSAPPRFENGREGSSSAPAAPPERPRPSDARTATAPPSSTAASAEQPRAAPNFEPARAETPPTTHRVPAANHSASLVAAAGAPRARDRP